MTWASTERLKAFVPHQATLASFGPKLGPRPGRDQRPAGPRTLALPDPGNAIGRSLGSVATRCKGPEEEKHHPADADEPEEEKHHPADADEPEEESRGPDRPGREVELLPGGHTGDGVVALGQTSDPVRPRAAEGIQADSCKAREDTP
ncbi:MAG: hypothetical protein V5A24_00845 [Haloarculaceae archaeon]